MRHDSHHRWLSFTPRVAFDFTLLPGPPETPRTTSDTKRPKEGTKVRGQCLRLLQRSEVAATRHRRPALDVQSLLGHRAWWPYDLTWKGEIGGGHFDARAGGHGPVAMPVRIVGPEG